MKSPSSAPDAGGAPLAQEVLFAPKKRRNLTPKIFTSGGEGTDRNATIAFWLFVAPALIGLLVFRVSADFVGLRFVAFLRAKYHHADPFRRFSPTTSILLTDEAFFTFDEQHSGVSRFLSCR